MSLLFCKELSKFFWLNRQHFDGLVEKSNFVLLVVMAVFVILPSNYYFSLIVIAVPKTKFSVLLFILNKQGCVALEILRQLACALSAWSESSNLKEGYSYIYTGKIPSKIEQIQFKQWDLELSHYKLHAFPFFCAKTILVCLFRDRQLNKLTYPALHYPECYLLHDGYKVFYENYPELCHPRAYVQMADKNFRSGHLNNQTLLSTFS